MKTLVLLLLLALPAFAEDPKPFVLPSEQTKTLQEMRAERQAAERFADRLIEQVRAQQQADALTRIARALENRR